MHVSQMLRVLAQIRIVVSGSLEVRTARMVTRTDIKPAENLFQYACIFQIFHARDYNMSLLVLAARPIQAS